MDLNQHSADQGPISLSCFKAQYNYAPKIRSPAKLPNHMYNPWLTPYLFFAEQNINFKHNILEKQLYEIGPRTSALEFESARPLVHDTPCRFLWHVCTLLFFPN